MTSKYHEIEQQQGKSMEQILIDLFDAHGHERRSQEVIAAQLGVSQSTVSQWIKDLRLVQKTVLIRKQNGGEQRPIETP